MTNGTLTHPDGKKYVGELKNGKRHGRGIYIYHDSSTNMGVWKDDEYVGE